MKKAFFAVVLLALLIGCFSVLADEPAKNTLYLSLTAVKDGSEMPADAVMWQKISNKYYWFLPGCTNLSEARVWFAGGGSITVNSKAVRSGEKLSGLKSGKSVTIVFQKKKYTINVMQGSQIPAVFVSTESGSMAKVDKAKANKEKGALRLMQKGGVITFDGALEFIKLRGNTAATFNKKGYTLKLTEKADLLAMGKAKKWVLTSNARDHSLLRNQIVHAMADYVGLPYTPECRQVEVYLNHAYNGTYILLEKIEIGKNRVNIADLEKATEQVNSKPLDDYPVAGATKVTRGQYKYVNIPNDPDDITGGYLIEYENWQARYGEEVCAYTTDRGKLIMVKEPERATKAQMAYISSFMQSYENAIFDKNGVDPKTGKHYSEFVDFDSLVLKYMLEEISKNCDGNKSSQYYYKPADSESTVAFAGPAWDYDTTFGVYAREREKKTLLSPTGYCQNIVASSFWWPQLYAKKDFYAGVCKMWKTRYAGAMRILLGKEKDPNGKLLSIAQYTAAIDKSAEMNFVRWPIRQSSENLAKCGKTFKANVEYLTNFIQQRYDFLESEWGK